MKRPLLVRLIERAGIAKVIVIALALVGAILYLVFGGER